MKQQDQESVNFKEIVPKILNVKAKAGLNLNIMVQHLDICYPKSHCLFINTTAKVQIQGIIIKRFCPKKSKAKEIKHAYVNIAKFLK